MRGLVLFGLILVALLAEGVDRNTLASGKKVLWDEVALLAEGVDRNNLNLNNPRSNSKSPSSRRAWIEIYVKKTNPRTDLVALLAEGVDRNVVASIRSKTRTGRPPRGGRG